MIKQFTELEKIVVLDFGSQYDQLITRRIREFGVFSELVSHRTTAEDIKAMGNVKGVIFSGGPNSVYEEDAFKVDPAIFDMGIPVLGICYGLSLIYISEPTRRYAIWYAVFCLKTTQIQRTKTVCQDR